MKIVKKINNNVAIGLDQSGQELIVFGKGIGFGKIPYELTDLKKIDKTFYNIDQRYYSLVNELPIELFDYIYQLLKVIKSKKDFEFNPNLVFVLSDHINFAIQRQKKGIQFSMPYSYDLEYDYPELTQCAKWIVKNIENKMHVTFEKGEVGCITMHLVSALSKEKREIEQVDTEKIITDVTCIIEKYFDIKVNKKSIHYYRFTNHIKYFVQRRKDRNQFDENHLDLYQMIKKEYPHEFGCVKQIDKYFMGIFNEPCSSDELVYLFMHVDRLCKKEDCNQMGITSKS